MIAKYIRFRINKNTATKIINIQNPKLWNIESPYLYKAKIILKQNGKNIDEQTQNFGVRSIHFDAKTGFTLNGKSIIKNYLLIFTII